MQRSPAPRTELPGAVAAAYERARRHGFTLSCEPEVGRLLATLAAMRLLVPQAVVTIVPRTEPVAASLYFDVTADGQPLDGDAAFAVASLLALLAVLTLVLKRFLEWRMGRAARAA